MLFCGKCLSLHPKDAQTNKKMASFETIGFISAIKYLPDSVIVFVDEFHKGYRRSDGTYVDDKYLTYRTIWKPYFKKFIASHFGNGMLVDIKGEILPYAMERDRVVDGYTVIGQCINLASFPRSSVKFEQKMMQESQSSVSGMPDPEGYAQPDF